MKKIVIGLTGLVALIFAAILVVSATSVDKKKGKACSEIVTKCPQSPASACCHVTEGKKEAACEPAKCREAGCDHEKCSTECMDASDATKCSTAKCGHKSAATK